MPFNLADLIARTTDRTIHNPDYWKRVNLPMPSKFLEDSIEIPESIKKDTDRDIDEPDQYDELVQDRASELITHYDNSKRVSEIGEELYAVASANLGST